LFFTWLAAERLWGHRAAWIASIILAVNHYFIHLMRCGVGYTQATFFGSVVFYCFVRAYDDRKRSRVYPWIHLGGVFMGLSLLSYQANHILPPLWGLLFLFVWAVRRIDWRLFLKGIAGAYAAMILMVSPLLLLHGIAVLPFRNRSQQVVIFSDEAMRHLESVYHTNGNRRIILQQQLKRALLAPVVYPDKSLQYGGPKPMLDPVAAGLLMLGVVIACCSIRHPREMFPLLWIVSLLTVGAALTVDAPFYPRIAGVVPMLALLAGRTLDRLTRFPGGVRSRLVRGVQIGAVLVVLGVIAFHNVRTYFWEYRPDRSMHYAVTLMAHRIAEQSPETFTYFMVPPQFYFNMGTIRLIAGDHPGMDVEEPSAIIPSLPLNPERPLLFIVGLHRLEAVAMIQARYPNAQVTEHRNPDGTHLFTSVLVSPATSSETWVFRRKELYCTAISLPKG
jgi:4-amino-4-deoxy-L-arabinose transferase-like glycosyltransferase